MGWLSILDEAIEIAKARLLRFVRSMDDPSARFDVAMEEFTEAVRMLNRALVLMRAKKTQIEKFKVQIGDKVKYSRSRALNYKREGKEDLARVYAEQIAYFESTVAKCDEYSTLLEQRINVVEKELIRAGVAEEAIEVRGEVAKMSIEVSEAEIKMFEEVTGLKKHGTSLYDAVKRLETRSEEREATAQALREMVESGMLPTVAEQVFQPNVGRGEEILKELDDEIKKAQVEAEPEFPSSTGRTI